MTRHGTAWRILAVTALLATAAAPSFGESADGTDASSDFPSEQPWQEQATVVPPYPAQATLIKLDSRFEDYRYFIDPNSVSVGKHDRVVRYTVVIDSGEGVRNAFYEGIRCDSRQYKTYAYGTGDGPFHTASASEWKDIRSAAAFGYRRDLADFYVCDGRTIRLDPDEIVRRIKYPSFERDPTYMN